MKKTTYVALLRGINVGGNKKVSMAKLKDVFEKLGFDGVSTYINSGNVIFKTDKTDTERLRSKIETAIEKAFGFDVHTILKDYANIKKVCKALPLDLQNDTEQKTDVLFLKNEYCKKGSIKLIKINEKVDNLKYIDGAIIWNVKRSDYAKSGMNKFIGTEIYKNMTARNVNTVRKIADLMSEK